MLANPSKENHLALLPGAIYHSVNSPDILFVIEEIAAHGQACDCPMVQYRAITPTRDMPAGSLWSIDSGVFRRRMVRLWQQSKLDALWDGQWQTESPAMSKNARKLLGLSVLSLCQRHPEMKRVFLSRSACLWSLDELLALCV